MFWKPEFTLAQEAESMAEMREELRDIARQLRALSLGVQPQRTADLLADQIRGQMERIQLPRAA